MSFGRFVSALAIAIAAVSTSAPSRACQCVEMSLEREYAETSLVAEGELMAFREVREPGLAYPRKIAIVRLLHAYKGANGRARVEIEGGGKTCGFPFSAPGRYLVFAGEASDGTFVTTSCSRTREWAKAHAEVAAITKLAAQPAPVELDGGDASTPATLPDATAPPAATVPDLPKTPPASGCASCATSGAGAGIELPVLAALMLGSVRRRRR